MDPIEGMVGSFAKLAARQTSCLPPSMETFPTRLSVNVNKVATLRNARGGRVPCPIEAARRIQEWGADGITVHPRPDARHITYDDVRALRPVVHTEFNIEGYPSDDFVELVLEVRPEQVTLVPDPPDALTSNAGWDTLAEADRLRPVLSRFREAGIRTSLFIETDDARIRAAAELGADRIELYTEAFAVAYPRIRSRPWPRLRMLHPPLTRSDSGSMPATTSTSTTWPISPLRFPTSRRCPSAMP